MQPGGLFPELPFLQSTVLYYPNFPKKNQKSYKKNALCFYRIAIFKWFFNFDTFYRILMHISGVNAINLKRIKKK